MVAIAAKRTIFSGWLKDSGTPETREDLMLTISKAIRRTQTPDGGILLDIERGQMFCLNVIGSKILELLDTGCDEEQIAAQLSVTCGEDIDTVRADVRDFLEVLNRHQILRQSPPAPTGEGEVARGNTHAT